MCNLAFSNRFYLPEPSAAWYSGRGRQTDAAGLWVGRCGRRCFERRNRMRTGRAGTRGWLLCLAVAAIGALFLAGSASAQVCVANKTLDFYGTEKLKLRGGGESETETDPLNLTVEFGSRTWKAWDEEGNYYTGKFKRKGKSKRKFKVKFSAASKRLFKRNTLDWARDIVGVNVKGKVQKIKITGRCSSTTAKIKITAKGKGKAGNVKGKLKYVGVTKASLY
jgi:hypothetical protein